MVGRIQITRQKRLLEINRSEPPYWLHLCDTPQFGIHGASKNLLCRQFFVEKYTHTIEEFYELIVDKLSRREEIYIVDVRDYC